MQEGARVRQLTVGAAAQRMARTTDVAPVLDDERVVGIVTANP